MKTSSTYFWGLALLALSIISCSKSTESTTATPIADQSSFALMQDKIITPNCATTGCHASEADNTFKKHGLSFNQKCSV